MSSITNLSTFKINYLTEQQYQDAIEAGTINENELYMTPASGGGGGGSNVSVLPIQLTGTKIGTITVDGVAYDIYSPTPPSSTSELINDSNFVSDASYVHTDNNFTTTEKTKLSNIAAGAEVNVQSDWNVTDSSSDAFIRNKPTIPQEVIVDEVLSSTSTNAVQNKVIYAALEEKVDIPNYITNTEIENMLTM